MVLETFLEMLSGSSVLQFLVTWHGETENLDRMHETPSRSERAWDVHAQFKPLSMAMTVGAQTCVHETSVRRDDLDCSWGSRNTRTNLRTFRKFNIRRFIWEPHGEQKHFFPTPHASTIVFLDADYGASQA